VEDGELGGAQAEHVFSGIGFPHRLDL
jgi:hypothetical protein